MNKRIIIAGTIALVLTGGGLFFANQQSQNTEKTANNLPAGRQVQKDTTEIETPEQEAMEKDKATMKKGDDRMGDSTSHYVEYSKAALDNAVNNRRVLFFYANWCPTCRPTDLDLKANISKIPADIIVIRVNYNDTDTDQEEKDLAKKYGITYQHTFVQIDSLGKEVTKWNGGETDELLAKIK